MQQLCCLESADKKENENIFIMGKKVLQLYHRRNNLRQSVRVMCLGTGVWEMVSGACAHKSKGYLNRLQFVQELPTL